jgi:hypothetical protein
MRKCPALVYISDDDQLTMKYSHSHCSMENKIEMLTIKNTILQKAKETRDTPRHIIANTTKHISDKALESIQTWKSMTNAINRERNRYLKQFKINKTDIPSFLKNNLRGERFLYFDSGVEEDRFLIFMSDFSSAQLCRSRVWLCDGTFFASPSEFTQLITIHGFLYGKTIHYLIF